MSVRGSPDSYRDAFGFLNFFCGWEKFFNYSFHNCFLKVFVIASQFNFFLGGEKHTLLKTLAVALACSGF